MSNDRNLDALYTVGEQLSGDALLQIFSARANPQTFDYAMLYACTQVRASTPAERESGIRHFLGKIQEKNLDNDTIRTILETQDAKLPDGELLLMRAGDLVSYQHFQTHWQEFLYQNHPALRAVFDAGFSGGAPACLCEQIRGGLERNAVHALDLQLKLDIALQAVCAVEILHRQGIAHGALRPAQFSVIRTVDGVNVRLTALGVIPDLEGALMAGDGEDLKEYFSYCSARQLAGGRPDQAGDIHALGAYLYSLMTGSEPWAQCRRVQDILDAIKHREEPLDAQELELLSPEIRSVILAALEGDEQYSNIGELIGDLDACLCGHPVKALQMLQKGVAIQEAQHGAIPAAVSEAGGQELPGAEESAPVTENSMLESASVPAVEKADAEMTAPAVADVQQTPSRLFAESEQKGSLDIEQMSAGMNRIGRSTMLKVVATVGVLAICALAGFFFSGSGKMQPEGDSLPIAGNRESDSAAPQVAVAAQKTAGSTPEPAVLELLQKGNLAMQAQDYTAAIAAFTEARKLAPTPENEGLLQAAQAGAERAQKRDASLALAEQMLAEGNLDAAETSILSVLSMPGYAQDAQALAVQKKLLAHRYQTALAEGQKHLQQKNWRDAAAAFAWALSTRGYENDEQALQGRKKAEEELALEEQLQQRKEQEQAQRQSRFNAAIAAARQLESAGRWEEAVAAYNAALQLEGFNADPVALAARTQAQQKAQERKSVLAERKKDAVKARYEALLKRGQALLHARQWAQAEEAFAQAGNLDGFAGSPLAQDGRNQAIRGSAADSERVKFDNLLLEGMQRIREKKYSDADKTFREALKVKGHEHDALARQLLMFAETANKINGKVGAYSEHIILGDKLLAEGKAEAAALEYGRALVADPAQTDPLVRRGLAYLKTGNNEKAMSSFKQALESQPGLPAALAGETVVLLREEKYEAAQEDLATLMQSSNATPQQKLWAEAAQGWLIFNPIGRALRRLGVEIDNDKAVALLRAASDEGEAGAQNNLAVAYWRGRGAQRDEKQALELLERSAKSGNPAALFNLGLFYYTADGDLRDYAKALEYFQKAAAADYPRAYGRLAEMYRRGRGVEKDKERANEYAEKFGGRTDSEDDPALAEPGLGFYQPVSLAQKQPEMKTELSEQYASIMDEAKSLLRKGESAAARRTFMLAQMLEGYESDVTIRAGLDAAQKAVDEGAAVLSSFPELPSLTVVEIEEPSVNSKKPVDPAMPNLGASTLPETSATPVTPMAAVTQSPVPGVAPDLFRKEYDALLMEGKALLTRQKIGESEQAFRLAQQIPGVKPEAAAVGLKAAQDARKKSPDWVGKPTDFEAIIGSASDAMRDRLWQQALHLFQYAQGLSGRKDDPVARIGADVARRTIEAVAVAQLQPQTEQKMPTGSSRDMDSYKVAMTQAQEFFNQKNFDAAAQLAKIVLEMKGFKDDVAASTLLVAAQSAIALEQNSPEAKLLNRQKNAKLYNDLILSGRMYLKSSDWLKAEKALATAVKLPGYVDEPEAVQMLAAAKAHTVPGKDGAGEGGGAGAVGGNPSNSFITEQDDPEKVRQKAEFDAIFREAKRQFELHQYEAAEATFDLALKVKGYEGAPEALALKAQASALKPKAKEINIPQNQDASPTDSGLEMKQQAQMLLREGDRLRNEKKITEAIQAYGSGLDLDPDNVQLRINRGDTLAASGQFSLALSDYEKALKTTDLENDQLSYILNNIANVYYYGLHDMPKAVEQYRKAASAGNAAAMNSLGVCYGGGKGVEKDPAQALQWYKEAANKEYANAMLNLGLAYQNGWGAAPNNQEALRWYQEAANRNVPRALLRVALMYREGLGVEKDEAKAAEYEKKARALGYAKDR